MTANDTRLLPALMANSVHDRPANSPPTAWLVTWKPMEAIRPMTIPSMNETGPRAVMTTSKTSASTYAVINAPRMAMTYSIGFGDVLSSRPVRAAHCFPNTWGRYQTVPMTTLATAARITASQFTAE